MKISIKLLRCVKCNNIYENQSSYIEDFPYKDLFEIVCSKCRNKWLICAIHDHRWSQRRYRFAENHVKSAHQNINKDSLSNLSNKNNSLPINEDVTQPDDFSCNEDTCTIIENTVNLSAFDRSPDSISFQNFVKCHKDISFLQYNDKVKRYIDCESKNPGDGIKQIVKSAFAMNLNCDYSQISIAEIKYHLKATIFCCSLTASQQANFGELCHMMLSNFLNIDNNTNRNVMSRIPVSAKEVDRYYLKRSTSIVQNVPIPNIIEFDDHACVSIKEIIQHVLYFEIPLDGMLTTKTKSNFKQLISSSSIMMNTAISDLIRSEVQNNLPSNSEICPLILSVILWSDDFEPNNIKQHKKSTWLKTITICPPVGYQTSNNHTFIIALGPKDRCHEKVNTFFFQQLKELESPTFMYCKSTNTNIPVVIKILAISADRPERSSLNSMLGHNGISTKRWRFSAYLNHQKLKSCKLCMKNRIQSMNNIVPPNEKLCGTCYDWNYDHPAMNENKPHNYPITQHPDSPSPPVGREVLNRSFLYPIELSYEIMKEGVQFCFFNVYHGYRTKASSIVYLKSIGINESFAIKNVYNKACLQQSHPLPRQ